MAQRPPSRESGDNAPGDEFSQQGSQDLLVAHLPVIGIEHVAEQGDRELCIGDLAGREVGMGRYVEPSADRQALPRWKAVDKARADHELTTVQQLVLWIESTVVRRSDAHWLGRANIAIDRGWMHRGSSSGLPSGALANVHHSSREAADVAAVVRARDTTDEVAGSFAADVRPWSGPGKSPTHRQRCEVASSSVSQARSHTLDVAPDAPIKHQNES
jgi:hypothetical protein